MATIVTRSGKGSPLTNNEVDANFTNLNTDKLESGDTAASLTITTADINGGTIDGVTIGGSSAGAITGTTITGTSFVSSGDMTFGDNDKAIFGADSDFAVYHNGSNGFVENETGLLILKNNSDDRDVAIQSDDGSGGIANYLVADGSTGALNAYHYGSLKLATTSTGIDVTGTVTADGLTVEGTNGNFEVATTGNSVNMTRAGNNFITASDAVGDLFLGAGGVSFFKIDNGGDISFYDSAGSSQSFFWDASAESLGIGTTSPAGILHLQESAGGNVELHMRETTGGTAYGASLDAFNSGGGNLRIRLHDSGGTLQEVIRFKSDGSVGIGLTNPSDYYAENLVVAAADEGGITIECGSTEKAYLMFAQGTSGSDAYRSYVGYDHNLDSMNIVSSGYINFFTDDPSTEAMRIDSSGRLLIGRTSNYGGEALQIDANSVGATVYTAYISNTNTSTSAYNVMRWAQGATGSATGMIGTGGSATGNAAFRNNFVVGTQSSSPLVFATADAERARIDSSGNLLVGKTSADFSDSSRGNVEIGGSGGAILALKAGSTNDYIFNSGSNLDILAGSGQGVLFYTNGSNERARIDSSGNLLVGTTDLNPQSSSSESGVRVGDGFIFAGRAGEVAILNRQSTDGDITVFRKDGTTVGSIGSNSGTYMYAGTGDTGILFNVDANGVQPWNTSTNGNSDGLLNLGFSTSRFKDLYLSGGAYLGGTGAANKLDDYEEGTFTPSSYSGWNTNPTGWTGKYTKIGNMVTLFVDIAGGVFNNQCYIVGLPFSATQEGTGVVLNGSITNVADAFAASTNRIWFRATNGTSSDGARFSLTYQTA